jgi:hypothetical protein
VFSTNKVSIFPKFSLEFGYFANRTPGALLVEEELFSRVRLKEAKSQKSETVE